MNSDISEKEVAPLTTTCIEEDEDPEQQQPENCVEYLNHLEVSKTLLTAISVANAILKVGPDWDKCKLSC